MSKSFYVGAVALILTPLLALANVSDYLSVHSSTVKGAVGDVVPITFTITSKNVDCGNYQVNLKGNDTAHTHLSFTGKGSPAITLREEGAVYWSGQEIHTGDSLKFIAYVKIVQGTPDQTISGFQVLSGCGLYDHYSVTAGTPMVQVISSATTTPAPTPIPSKIATPVPTTVVTTTTKLVLPVSTTTPVVKPTNPGNLDGDDLPHDQETIQDSNPLTTVQPEITPALFQQSFFGRMVTGLRGYFRTVGTWFSEVF